MTNPFSPKYVSQIKTDHRDTKYRRPKLNQPPANARANLVPEPDLPRCVTFTRISQTKI